MPNFGGAKATKYPPTANFMRHSKQASNDHVEQVKKDLRYLRLLAEQFGNTAEASTEIINLEAILSLPKGTEHFLADVHGEYEAFNHVLKNASGSVMRKIKEVLGAQILESEMKELATLIYYPTHKLELIKKEEGFNEDWYRVTLNRLVLVLRKVSEKYTRSKVRKALPKQYNYIIEELLHEDRLNTNKSAYFASILDTIIKTGQADDFIFAISNTIKRLVIDRLHIVGDIYDRGPGAQFIMDTITHYHNVDIQWGNHDVLWMGAAAGNASCMATVVRIALRYANLDTIEDGYGINLLPLARFAMETYANDPCKCFTPKMGDADRSYDDKSIYLISQMHKAIAIIQFKLEHQLIAAHPEYKMQNRDLLHKIDYAAGTIDLSETAPNGGYGIHPMKDKNFPTIDPKDPYKLTPEEEEVVDKLMKSFEHSEKLQAHMHTLYKKGSLYLVCNNNLLFHASMPLTQEREFKPVLIDGIAYSGRALFDQVDRLIRLAGDARNKTDREYQNAVDYMWYLWCGMDSPLFDKSAMTTLERYFVADKDTHKETKGNYYKYRPEEEIAEMILREFGLEGADCHIINGHVPVKAVKGEKPIMAGGKIMVIDGGFSRAYQASTGIAGYTLIYNSQGLQLVQHEPFTCSRKAIEEMDDIKSVTVVRESTSHRILVADTDIGKQLKQQVEDLSNLLVAFRMGFIKEKSTSDKKSTK